MNHSGRNRTMTLTEKERAELQSRLVLPEGRKLSAGDITDRTILADLRTVLPDLPSAFVDLLILDPPYNLTKNYNGTRFHAASDTDYASYVESWFRPLLRLLKENASLYVCCDWRSSPVIYSVLARHCRVRNRITWQREKGRGAQTNWKNAMEDIWFATMSSAYYFNVEAVKMKRRVIAPYRSEGGAPKDWTTESSGAFRLTHPSNFWDDISVPYWSMPENTPHPTQKPEKLLAKLILASSAPGAFVFDPFAGSGTTAVTAKKLGRHFASVEMELEYCLFTEKRLRNAEKDSRIQGYTDGCFWERNTLSHQKRMERAAMQKNKRPESSG